MTKRSFFKRLASAAAVIALAPQLAFRTPIKKVVEVAEPQFDGFIASLYLQVSLYGYAEIKVDEKKYRIEAVSP